jgi:sugar phosphate isomerase/epimerase
MFKNLNLGNIGVRIPLYDAAALAKAADFRGMDIDINEVASLVETKSLGYVKNILANASLRFGGWELPLRWNEENEVAFQADLVQLSGLASVGRRLDCVRVFTWVLPYSDKRPFKENFDWHVTRLQPIAETLKDHSCRLGLEFVGTKSFRAHHKYEFIYTMEGMLELCDSIGTGNVGLLLDSWHWHMSQGTVDDLKQLTAKEVIYVHINDAPPGIPPDEQIDTVRCLPGETGVINLVSFLVPLREIGYGGPVTPEPFSKKLKEMPVSKAVQTVGKALNRVWQAAGLS